MRLCQREAASCGACCGLYNRVDFGRPALRAELARRTEALRGVPRTPGALREAAASLAASGPPPLFRSVRVCPLLGFLDEEQRRVGCLGHPAATGGVDLRDCGVYDAAICESFLCPSHAFLSEEEARLAEVATGDFYLYGLVVTDVDFLRASLEAVGEHVGARIEARHLEDARFRAALHALLALKEELAPGSEGLFGAFEPGPDGPDGEPVHRRIDYGAIGRRGSTYDRILTCVGADPQSGNDLDELEAEVQRRLDACAAAFPVR